MDVDRRCGLCGMLVSGIYDKHCQCSPETAFLNQKKWEELIIWNPEHALCIIDEVSV